MELLKDWSYLDDKPYTKCSPKEKKTKIKKMNKRVRSSKVLGRSERSCPKCSGVMDVRHHPKITEKLKSKYYYYSRWDFCMPCNAVFFEDKYKVLTRKGELWQENLEKMNFVKDI